MRKKGRMKYFLVIFLCFSILVYGFIKVNINKEKDVKIISGFAIDFKLKPFDFKVETADYIFYVNSKVIDNLKEECVSVYNEIFSK